jgi:hypothetical protein
VPSRAGLCADQGMDRHGKDKAGAVARQRRVSVRWDASFLRSRPLEHGPEVQCRSGDRFEAGEPVYAHEGRRCCGTLGYRLGLSAETILAHVAGCRMLLMWLDRRFPGEGRPQPGLGRIMVVAKPGDGTAPPCRGGLVGGCLSRVGCTRRLGYQPHSPVINNDIGSGWSITGE